MINNNDPAFGAPILNAETNGAKIIEDPTYNPAERKKTETTPVTEEEKPAIEITDDGLQFNVDGSSRNNLIGILVVIVVVVICCFGCGVATVCAYQVQKASKQVNEIRARHA